MSTTHDDGLTAGGQRGSVGDPLPELVLPDLHGGEIALHDYQGKRLLLFFWASW